MSIQTRVAEYHKTNFNIKIGDVIARSKDGNCIIFHTVNQTTKSIGTLRAVTISQQNKSFIQESLNHCVNAINNASATETKFLSPVQLSKETLDKEVKKLQTLSLLFPNITYAIHEWKEGYTFGTDIYIYQTEDTNIELVAQQKATTITSLQPKNIPTTNSPQKNTTTTLQQPKTTGMLKQCYLTPNQIFGKELDRDKITKIIFHNTQKNIPLDAWDASQEQNGSIKAWEKGGVLHICANGPVVANPNSRFLFAQFSNLKSIDFGNYLDVSGKKVNGMKTCFDTSQVTDMSYMFYDCPSLTTLDLDEFNTSKVTTMSAMFWGCRNLTSLSLSNFDTKKLKDMSWMFKDCSKLKNLNLKHFYVGPNTYTSYMFNNCDPNLEKTCGFKK